MTGFSPIVVRCFLASCCLLIICRAAPAADQALVQSVRTTTEATPVTTEELEFKDVPIFEKDKPRKPAPGTKVVAVLKCKNKDGEHALETTASESSDGQRSQDQKEESHETIHDPSGTTAKDAPRVPPTGQQIQDKGQHQLVPDAQTDSIVGIVAGIVAGAEPTLHLAATAQAVPADDGQATSSAKVEKSETEALDAITDVKMTKDESIPVEDKLATVSQKPAKGSQPSKPVEEPSSDKLAEELIKTAPVVKEDAKKETTIIADEDNEGKIAAADAVLVTPTEELKPESQVVPVASVGVKEKDSSIILESTKSDVVVSDNKKETTKITDFVPVVSANSEKTDKVVALVDVSSEILSASAPEKSKLAVVDSKTPGTITADATKLDDKKDVSSEDSVPAVSKISEKPNEVVALVDISSEILTSVPEKSDLVVDSQPAVKTPIEEPKPDSQVPLISDKVKVETEKLEESSISSTVEQAKSDATKSDDKKDVSKDSDSVPVVSKISEKPDKVVVLVDVSSETLLESALDKTDLVDDSQTAVTTPVKEQKPESEIIPLISDEVKVETEQVKESLISSAVKPAKFDATKSDDKKDVSKDSDSVATVVDVSSEILSASTPEKSKLDVDSKTVVTTPIEKPKPESQVVPLLSDEGIKVETEKVKGSSVSSAVEPVKSDASKSDDEKNISEDSDSILAVSATSEKPDKVVVLVDVSSETLLESALDKTDLVDDSQTAVTTPVKEQKPESEIIPLISDEVKVETEKVKESLISSAVKPANSDATKSDDKKEISKDSDSVATAVVDVSSEILSASTPEKSKLDVDSKTVVTTPIEKPKPESQVVPLLSDEGIKVETEKVKGSSVSSAVEPVKSDASKSDDEKNISEDSDSILAVSATSEKLDKVVALVDISSEILTSIPEKSGLVVDSQTAVSSPTGEKKPESQVNPLNSNKVKVELEKVEGDSVSSVVKPAKPDVTELDDKKEISATSDSVPDVSAVSDDKTVASINVAPETPAFIQKKANSTINTIKKDDFETNFESTNAIVNKEEGVKDFTGYKVYRVIVPTEEAARWILKFEDVPGIEFWADPKLLLRPRGMFVTSAADILVAPDVAEYIEEALRQARLPFEILIKDVQDAIRNENPSEPVDVEELTSRNGHSLTWERYHSLEDIYSYLDYLKVTFPDFVTVTEIGRTTENRPIKAIRLSQKSSRSDKKAILIDAGIHAREWITPATITYMIREIVDNPTKYNCIMNEFDWLFVPVLNPDGYAYTQTNNRMWRKTRSQTENIVFRQSAEASLRADRLTRFEDDPILDDAILEKLRAEVASNKASLSCTGADANRNFDYHWLTGGSSRNPCSDTFAGAKPFSEPEARALRDLVMDNKDQLSMYISLHAYSQMWLIPWGFKQQKPDDFSDLYSLAKIGSKALETVNGVNYLIGSIPDLLYIASGSSIDWVKGAVGVKYSYTLELRDSGRYGFLLPANQIIPSGKETWIALYATAVELSSRVYTDSANCPAV